MSFLNDLCTMRHSLKPTTTILTFPDGRKFEERHLDNTLVEVTKAQFGFIVDTKPDNVPAKITDYLFLGSQDCCDLEILQNHNISHVLSVGIEAPTKYENIVYTSVPCLDLPETNIDEVLEDSVSFIDEAVQKQCHVLVHCNAGVSRSASVVIGYLISVCGYSYDDAYYLVKNVRSCIRPNDGFIRQLKRLGSK